MKSFTLRFHFYFWIQLKSTFNEIRKLEQDTRAEIFELKSELTRFWEAILRNDDAAPYRSYKGSWPQIAGERQKETDDISRSILSLASVMVLDKSGTEKAPGYAFCMQYV